MKADNLGIHRRASNHLSWGFLALLAACLALVPQVRAGFWSPDTVVSAPKYGIFETSFKSSVVYASPLEDASLTVVFTSPLGDMSLVHGFWDGGKTWKVRFSPDLLGKWKFHATCSDITNAGLNDLSGEFLCMAAIDHSPFDDHGPVRVARDHEHFEYADHTPFFWVADTVWDGAVASKPADWDNYAQVRTREKFNVAQWIASPEHDPEGLSAYTGTRPLQINLKFFKEMDKKIAALNRAGILNAIAAHEEIHYHGTNLLTALPEQQTILLLRYMVARWGANDVVWLVTCDGTDIARCKHILHAVFGDIAHAPVILFPGDAYWVLNRFRNEPLVDVFGYQSGQDVGDDSLAWLQFGPITKDWKREPLRPWLNLAPAYENESAETAPSRNSAFAARRAAYWSALETPTSGVGYGGHGVWDWDTAVDASSATPGYQSLATWQKCLYMPAAKQMGVLANVFNSIDFWRLRPAPELIANQPGQQAPGRYIAAAVTEDKDLAVIYIPEDREVELNLKSLPRSPTAYWINPLTGARTAVTISFEGPTGKLSTPEAGDWLLLIQGAKK